MPTITPARMSTSATIRATVGRSPNKNRATTTLTAGTPSRPSEVVEAGKSEELTAAAQYARAVPGMPANSSSPIE